MKCLASSTNDPRNVRPIAASSKFSPHLITGYSLMYYCNIA